MTRWPLRWQPSRRTWPFICAPILRSIQIILLSQAVGCFDGDATHADLVDEPGEAYDGGDGEEENENEGVVAVHWSVVVIEWDAWKDDCARKEKQELAMSYLV